MFWVFFGTGSVAIIKPQTLFSMAKKVVKPRTQTANAPSSKGGRPRAYTPEALEAKFEEYVEWAKSNPLKKQVASKAGPMDLGIQQPLTIVAFCVFAGISRETFYTYEDKPEFSDIIARARATIEANQLTGAMAGIYDAGIVARVLQLTDRHDVTTDGKEIMPAAPAITFTVDEAAASIIQSIGRQTINTSQADGE